MPPPSTDDPPTSGSLSGVDVPLGPYQILADAEACLVGINHEIARLQIDQAEKMRIIDEQRTVLNTLSALNRLMTDDILFVIFSTVVRNHRGPYPWVLAAVCRRWRNVCLDSPALWSQLRLGSMHHCDRDKYDSAAVSRTLLQIERSQTAPLHIIIDACICQCPSQVSIFQAAIAHSKRWESVTLQPPRSFIWYHTDLEALQRLLPRNSNFTGLQKIHWQPVRSGSFSSPYPHALPFSECSRLTSLHHLSLVGFGVRLSGNRLGANISWTQLTHLHIGSCGGHRELLFALIDCQNLTSLGIDFSLGDWEEVDLEEGSVVLLLLKELSIHVDAESVNISEAGAGPIPVIPYLSVPNIRTMRVGDFSREGLFRVVSDLIERSSCSEIHDLVIVSESLSFQDVDEGLRPLLQKTPQVRQLTLQPSYWRRSLHGEESNPAIRCLILDDDNSCTSQWLCPHLKELHLSDIDPDPMVLIQMVDSRIEGSRGQPAQRARLKRLEWRSTRDEEEYNFCRAALEQRYSDSGLKFEFSRRDEDD